MNPSSLAAPKTAVLLVAAGSSTRFGGDKLTALIALKPLISYSLRAFAETPLVSSIILVVSPGREEEFGKLVNDLKMPQLRAMTRIVTGGSTRHESVQQGIAFVPADTCFVAIHDGARPLLTRTQIESVCRAAYEHGAAALAHPVTDTLHRASTEGYAEETVAREQLWSMQTPQVFRLTDLKNIFSSNQLSKNHFTDEVSALLHHGIKTVLIENKEPNFKVTYQADLKLIEACLKAKLTSSDLLLA